MTHPINRRRVWATAIAAALMAALLIAVALPTTVAATDVFYVSPTGNDGNTGGVSDPFRTVLRAIGAADPGATINVAAGTYDETGRLNINADLTIAGDPAGKAVIRPAFDTTDSGDDRAFFVVAPDVDFAISNVNIDGNGRKVWQAIRSLGRLTVTNVDFVDIQFESSGPAYAGTAILIFGEDAARDLTLTGSTFSQIGRTGVLVLGSGSDAVISGNTYTGKGDGNFLDYAFEIGSGGVVSISGNVIRDSRGVSSADGAGSAGILITTFFGDGSAATITNNLFSANRRGIAVGASAADTSAVTVHFNSFSNTIDAIRSTAGPTVNATDNWWGSATGPTHASNAEGTGDAVSDSVTFDPWLATVSLPASSPSAPSTGDAVTVSATLLDRNGAEATPSGLTARFTHTLGGASPSTADVAFGSPAVHLYSSNAAGTDTVTATVLFAGQASTLFGATDVVWGGVDGPPVPDNDGDGDGIVDAVDADPNNASAAFNDGAGTSGTIVADGGLTIVIADDPANGVIITVSGAGGSAIIDVDSVLIMLTTGDVVSVGVGSVIIQVLAGPIDVAVSDVTMTIESGATATITDNRDGTVRVANAAGATGDVIVSAPGANDVTLSAGQSTTTGETGEPPGPPSETFPVSLNLGVNLIGWVGAPSTSTAILAGNSDIDIIWSVVNGAWVADSERLPAALRLTLVVGFGDGLVVVTSRATTLLVVVA